MQSHHCPMTTTGELGTHGNPENTTSSKISALCGIMAPTRLQASLPLLRKRLLVATKATLLEPSQPTLNAPVRQSSRSALASMLLPRVSALLALNKRKPLWAAEYSQSRQQGLTTM